MKSETRMFFYKVKIIIYALFNLPAPDYIDAYGRHYRIDKRGTWFRKDKIKERINKRRGMIQLKRKAVV
jgi:hypothetical protein